MSSAPLPDDMSSAPLVDDMSSTPLPDDMSSAEQSKHVLPLWSFRSKCQVNQEISLIYLTFWLISLISLTFGKFLPGYWPCGSHADDIYVCRWCVDVTCTWCGWRAHLWTTCGRQQLCIKANGLLGLLVIVGTVCKISRSFTTSDLRKNEVCYWFLSKSWLYLWWDYSLIGRWVLLKISQMSQDISSLKSTFWQRHLWSF